MKSLAVVPLVATAAMAFTVPAGLSQTCTAFLNTLDQDADMNKCTSSIISATSAFAPGSSGGDLSAALANLCGASSPCSQTSIPTTLSKFYAACPTELASNPNQVVLEIYDMLFTMEPMRDSICSEDDSSNSCLKQLSSSPPAANTLYSGSQQTLAPNFQALQSSNAAFLFLQPTLPEPQLCKPCTRSVMTSYITFESSNTYGPGLNNSILLAGQSPLYQAIQSTCGASFLSGAVQAAGSLSDGILGGHSGAASTLAGSSTGAIASLLGAVTVFVAAAL